MTDEEAIARLILTAKEYTDGDASKANSLLLLAAANLEPDQHQFQEIADLSWTLVHDDEDVEEDEE